MKMKWIKFLKDYEDHKKDAIVQVEEKIADSLVSLKFAEAAESPESDVVKAAIGELGDTIKTLVTAGVAEGMKSFSTELKTKLPAVARDHKKEGMGGFENESDFIHAIIRSSHGSGSIDKRLILDQELDVNQKGTPSGLNTRDDVQAGWLVPDTMAAGIWEHVIGPGTIMEQTDRRTTAGNSLLINGIEETSRKDTYRDGGVLAYWMAEADQYTASNPRFTRKRLELHKLGVLSYCTEEELSDSGTSLGPILSRKAGNAINFKVNEAFIWGSGVGKPLGAMESDCLIVANLVTNQGNNSILHQNINHMYHLLRPELRAGAKWFVHPNLEEQLEYIAFNDVYALGNTSATQIPIYLPPGGLTATPYGTLKGLPVIPLEYMKDLGSQGDIMLGNYSQYASLTKESGGIQFASSIHVRFLYDEQAFKWSFRIDGQPLWSTPIQDYNGTTVRGPFVTLASRATVSSSSGL